MIGGVILASVKELDFAWSALITASLANLFAAFKANENKKLMETPGIRDRLGGVGNQFAITTTLAFLISLPFMFWKEGAKFGEFIELFKTNSAVSSNLITSGLYFYLYNELATLTIKKTSATTQARPLAPSRHSPRASPGTPPASASRLPCVSADVSPWASAASQSVANTAKRVIVIVGSALAFGESLEAMKMLGCFICIGGVFAYSLVPRRSSNASALSPTTTTDPTPKRATCSRVRAPLWAGQVEAPRPSRAAPRGRRAARTGVICGALAHDVESAQESTSERVSREDSRAIRDALILYAQVTTDMARSHYAFFRGCRCVACVFPVTFFADSGSTLRTRT